MINLGYITTGELIDALSATLLHSLWQGLILAGLAALALASTRHKSAANRYNVLLMLIGLFVCTVALTFITLFHSPESQGQESLSRISTGYETVNLNQQLPVSASLGDRISASLYNNRNIVVMIWLVIVCVRISQLVVGLHNLKQLRRSVAPAVAHWQHKTMLLSEKLGINRKVMLVESQLAKMPMMIGHIKPIILLPFGLLSAMSTAEINAILIHELAHIRRRDYIVNIFQSLIEIFFFFNPGFMWASTLLRTERENCCDDAVLQHEGNRAHYIRALVACQEFTASSTLALGLKGTNGSLLSRINRMLSGENSSINAVEKTVLITCLIISGIIATAFGGKETLSQTATAIASIIKVEKPVELNPSAPDHANPEVTFVRPLRSGDQRQPSARQPKTKKQSNLLNYSSEARQESPFELAAQDTIIKPKPTAPAKPKPAPSFKPKTESLDDLDVKLSPLDSLDYNIKVNTASETKVNISSTHSEISKSTYNKTYQRNGSDSSYSVSIDSSYKVPVTVHVRPKIRIQRKSGNANIADELRSANIIFDKDNFTVSLNNSELIVNGAKQPGNKHQLVLSKYQRSPDDRVDIRLSYTNTNK